jgi:hypothetical protein
MKKLLLAASACLLMSGSAHAMTDADCTAMWKQADTDSDGTLKGAETDRYAAWMRVADKTMTSDGTIAEAGFLENCRADVFATAAVDADAPLTGANSFTEGQAKDRAIAAGFSNVSAMTKDDNGIWRGTADKDGKNVNVAVDYKGNAVAG